MMARIMTQQYYRRNRREGQAHGLPARRVTGQKLGAGRRRAANPRAMRWSDKGKKAFF